MTARAKRPSRRRCPGSAGRRWLATAVSTCLALLAGSLSAQDREDVFEGETAVVRVSVPVQVVDRSGSPVRGLTRDDFKVFEKGDLREIESFEVVDLQLEVPADPSPGQLEELVPAAARRHFLFLFDLTFSTPSSILRAREAAIDFALQNLHPSDLAAVATYSVEFGPRLLLTFTPDRVQLARAIDTLGARSLLREGQRDPLRFLIEPAGIAESANLLQGGEEATIRESLDAAVMAHLAVITEQMERQEKSFERGRIAGWSRGLQEMASVLKSVEGRKQIIYFSEGFDGRLLFGRVPDPSDPEVELDQLAIQQGRYWRVDTDDIYGNSALQANVHAMLNTFRRSDCVIHAVDIAALGGEVVADRRRARRAGQDALFYIAHETGGEFFQALNDLGSQLSDLVQLSTVTYLLTFSADDVQADGSYRPIEVRVATEQKVRVTHREGYFAPRPYEELHPLEKSLLAADAIAAAEPRNEIDVEILAAPFRATAETAYVPVILEIDGAGLLRNQSRSQLDLEIYVYVNDQKARMRDFFTQRVGLDISQGREAMSEAGVKYYGHLYLGPGKYLLRALVRNATTGRVGLTTLPLEVPDFGDPQPELLPPFFFESPGRWVLVREQGDEGRQSVVYPFTIRGQPFVPPARPELNADAETSFCMVAYNFGEGTLRARGSLLDVEGREVASDVIASVEDTLTGIEGVHKLLASLRPMALERGEYTLQVELSRAGSDVTRTSRTQVRVN